MSYSDYIAREGGRNTRRHAVTDRREKAPAVQAGASGWQREYDGIGNTRLLRNLAVPLQPQGRPYSKGIRGVKRDLTGCLEVAKWFVPALEGKGW